MDYWPPCCLSPFLQLMICGKNRVPGQLDISCHYKVCAAREAVAMEEVHT